MVLNSNIYSTVLLEYIFAFTWFINQIFRKRLSLDKPLNPLQTYYQDTFLCFSDSKTFQVNFGVSRLTLEWLHYLHWNMFVYTEINFHQSEVW